MALPRCLPLALAFALHLGAVGAHAQDRPPVFFREDWAETPPETPVTQAHVANRALVLSLHGPGRDSVKKSHHDRPADDPYYVWSGPARGPWAVSLRHRDADVDLRGLAEIRWRAKQSGFRLLRPVLRLADGTWLVGDAADGASADWREVEINVADVRWRRLDVARVVEGAWVEDPDLSRVVEVGVTDLMAGGASGASSRLDWIEVRGVPVPR